MVDLPDPNLPLSASERDAAFGPAEHAAMLKLWHQHRLSGPPPAWKGLEVQGVHVMTVLSVLVGCSSTFLLTGKLDAGRAQMLASTARDLERILPDLDRESLEYFAPVRALATLVLARLSSNEPAA